MNKWYGKWNILFDKWDATPYEVNVACKENDGQLSYHASFEKGKLSSQTTTDRSRSWSLDPRPDENSYLRKRFPHRECWRNHGILFILLFQ